jgi:Leucine-rich repeat (LRR) protein
MQPRPRLAFLLAAGMVAGCQGYSYTLNDRTVFEPPPLFAAYAIEDPALSACVQQAIEDGEIRAAEQLQDLNCSSAGLRSLAGIEVFSGLKRIGLDGNRLESLAPLASLAGLELVQARSNRLRELDPALCQGAKKRLAVAGNDTLTCAGIDTLRACGVVFEDTPAHCAP